MCSSALSGDGQEPTPQSPTKNRAGFVVAFFGFWLLWVLNMVLIIVVAAITSQEPSPSSAALLAALAAIGQITWDRDS
jgi:nicotinamide riboside transporter PnuC